MEAEVPMVVAMRKRKGGVEEIGIKTAQKGRGIESVKGNAVTARGTESGIATKTKNENVTGIIVNAIGPGTVRGIAGREIEGKTETGIAARGRSAE